MFRKVFISYAKEDHRYASDLYEFLKNNKYEPWLDKQKLLAGANWDYEIRKALKESDFIIMLLSSISVKKRGYVQREYKIALEYREQKLDGDIYIIPVLIDTCEVPDRLNEFQWIEYNEENAFQLILNSLDQQRTVYLKESYGTDILDCYYEKTLPLELPENLAVSGEIKFPQFSKNPFFNGDFVNVFIQNEVVKSITEFCNFIIQDDYYKHIPEHLLRLTYFSTYYEIFFISSKYLSLVLNVGSYAGGAHPSYYIITKNFSFNPVKILAIKDIVLYPDFKLFIKNCYIKYFNGTTESDEMIKNIVLNHLDHINEDNIDFLFNQAEVKFLIDNVMPHAFKRAGTITIPFKELESKLQFTDP